MDPGVLFGSKEMITARVQDTVDKARAAGVRHVMNLGHGVMQVGMGRAGRRMSLCIFTLSYCNVFR